MALAFDYVKVQPAGSLSMEERAEVKRLCAIYAADLEGLKTPQERIAYAHHATDAAEILARIG